MVNYELTLPPLLTKRPPRRTAGIEWTDEMLSTIRAKFATAYNKELAEELGVSWRTLVRKARELGLEKEAGFLDKRRGEITKMAQVARPENPTKGQKGFVIPGGEKYRFKPGHTPAIKGNRELIDRVHRTRNATIREERWRLSIGLGQRTKLRLINY